MIKQIVVLCLILTVSCLSAAKNSSAVFDIKQYGAVGDGKTLDSPAINKAIEAAAAAGGGTVRFPAGTYLSGSIRLKSNITLYLDSGAIIEAKADAAVYDPNEPNPWDKYQDFSHSHWHNSLIWGENLHDVSILGPGLIYGKGLTRSLRRDNLPDSLGNKSIALKNCRNVILRDISILRGGHFGILATGVDNLTIDNLKIDTNRDGMNIDCCRNVRISNCSVNSPWDDAICLKSSYGLGFARATENVTITNCLVAGGFEMGTLLDGTFKRILDNVRVSRTGRIKFGTESNGGFKNITISNCVFDNCQGLALETVDGGLLEDVTITNITMRDLVTPPIFIRLGSRMRGPEGVPVGKLRRVNISNIVAYNTASRYCSVISGIPGHPIEDVHISNIVCYVRGGGTKEQAAIVPPEKENAYPDPGMFGPTPSYGFFVRHVRGIDFHNVQIRCIEDDLRPAFVLDDVKDVRFDTLKTPKIENVPTFMLKNVEDFKLHQCEGLPDTQRKNASGAISGMLTPLTVGPFADRVEQDFNGDWRFAKGEQTESAKQLDFDDSAWQAVQLPHDWAISGPFNPEEHGYAGKLPWKGVGWYRKTFQLDKKDNGRQVYLDFDGVMAFPKVYVNGQLAGGWDYGYMSFRVDATSYVKFGEKNVVAVQVDTRNHGTRWYPGAGIYRKVTMTLCDPVHIGHWSTYIATPQIDDKFAVVRIRSAVENHLGAESKVNVTITVLDPKGKIPAVVNMTGLVIPAGDTRRLDQTVTIKNPQRWDITSPNLYTAKITITRDGKVVDTDIATFGIRTFEFTANDGFHLNGRRVQLYGACLHHDQGPLGAAFYPRAMQRQLEIMRDMGCNAIRTSHNPPAPELLKLCDRMGFVVWDECFDKWDDKADRVKGQPPLEEYGEKQIRNFVMRDRNYPCIVVWSIANEIGAQPYDKEGLSPERVKFMREFVLKYDATRPVGMACHIPEMANSKIPDALDLTGWNYMRRYGIMRERYPDKPIIYTESASALSTRGFYELPLPENKTEYSKQQLQVNSYDHNAAKWSDIPDREFELMQQDKFVAGEFVWTGFDYLGEPTPFDKEARSSYFGIVDLCGIPKDRYYLYRSYWRPDTTTIHILPHWNWPDRIGQKVPAYVYTNGDSAELFLNGKSLGKKTKLSPDARIDLQKDPYYAVLDKYRLRWLDVVYEPGELKAVAYKQGKKIGEAIMRTADKPAAIRLTPDRTKLSAAEPDLSYILVEAVDAKGNLCPLADNMIHFDIRGSGKIAGVGNGNPMSFEPFQADYRKLFYGKAMLIIRTEDNGGDIHITAKADGLKDGKTDLHSGDNLLEAIFGIFGIK